MTIYDSVDVGWIARVKESLPHKEALAAAMVEGLCVDDVIAYYVAFDASRDAVKVGTSRRPRLRLANLQVGNPVPLELVVDVAASTGVEQLVHQFLADVRVGGEWFSCSPSTLVVVAVLRGLEDWERTAAGDFDAGFAVDVLRSRASELLEAVSEQAA